jgi:hypothetical protein
MATERRALPLVSFDEKTEDFVIHEDALSILEAERDAVATVAICGPYRSGKSFLLNLLTTRAEQADKAAPSISKSGFAVGHSTVSCTKGLWMLDKPTTVQTADGSTVKVFFLDVEGFGATDKTSHYDARIFSIACLICSCLLYNSQGTIDESSIGNLAFIAHLTQQIKLRSASGQEQDQDGEDELSSGALKGFFPSFVWMLRDFLLEMSDEMGNEMTPDEYLDKALQPQQGYDQETLARNRTRHMLTSFFQERACFTLVRPAESEEQLRSVEDLGWEALRPSFRKEFEEFQTRFLGSLKPKKYRGVAMDGAMVGAMIRSYVLAVNSGGVPCVEDAWQNALRVQCTNALENGLKNYDEEMAAQMQAAREQGAQQGAQQGGDDDEFHDAEEAEDAAPAVEDAAPAVELSRAASRAPQSSIALDEEQLLQCHERVRAKVVRSFLVDLTGGSSADATQNKEAAKVCGQLEEKLGKKYRKLVNDNGAQCRRACEVALTKLYTHHICAPHTLAEEGKGAKEGGGKVGGGDKGAVGGGDKGAVGGGDKGAVGTRVRMLFMEWEELTTAFMTAAGVHGPLLVKLQALARFKEARLLADLSRIALQGEEQQQRRTAAEEARAVEAERAAAEVRAREGVLQARLEGEQQLGAALREQADQQRGRADAAEKRLERMKERMKEAQRKAGEQQAEAEAAARLHAAEAEEAKEGQRQEAAARGRHERREAELEAWRLQAEAAAEERATLHAEAKGRLQEQADGAQAARQTALQWETRYKEEAAARAAAEEKGEMDRARAEQRGDAQEEEHERERKQWAEERAELQQNAEGHEQKATEERLLKRSASEEVDALVNRLSEAEEAKKAAEEKHAQEAKGAVEARARLEEGARLHAESTERARKARANGEEERGRRAGAAQAAREERQQLARAVEEAERSARRRGEEHEEGLAALRREKERAERMGARREEEAERWRQQAEEGKRRAKEAVQQLEQERQARREMERARRQQQETGKTERQQLERGLEVSSSSSSGSSSRGDWR